MRCLTCFLALTCLSPALLASERPSFLVIIADDLGWSDLGCYGGEIQTPHLDSLASNGLRFTQFYNTARCWPTRSALLSGYYPQQIRRDSIPGVDPKGFGGQGVRPAWATLIPTRLKPLGYRSYHSGKWHVDGDVIASGFDHSFHIKDQGRFFNPKSLHQDDKPIPPVEKDSGFYSTIAVTDRLLSYLQNHITQHKKAPFFAYLAYAAPHFPLQALPEDIEKYRDRYLEGWDKLRTQRHQQQQKLGLQPAALSPLEPEVGPPYAFPDDLERLGAGEINRPIPWETLTAEQKRFQATKMAIHAAMIDRMDQEIGRIIAFLKASQKLDNTLILFLSDNGASAEIMVRDDGHDPAAPMGSASSYLCLGPGFSSAANTPFRRHKTWVHEGGISTPFIAHWPNGIPEKNALRTKPAHVIDVLPTLMELAGAPSTSLPDAPTLPGSSLIPAFKSGESSTHEALWFFHENNRAFRKGNWKIVADNKTQNWSLYNLSTDRAEQNDLSGAEPDRVKQMAEQWQSLADQFRTTALEGMPKPSSKQKGKGQSKKATN
jgi:arylsulfatase A-like enzyme